jgi:putative hydrolase of the HAD superfamily
MPSTTEAVFFDLDDTLFDQDYSRRSGLLALQQWDSRLSEVSFERLAQEHHAQIVASYDGVLDRHTTIEDDRVLRFSRMYKALGVDLSGQAESAISAFRCACERSRRPVPGAPSLLSLLNGRVALGVITNGLIEVQADKLRACGVRDWFDVVITSEEAGEKKPSDAPFLLALQRAGVAADSSVMVGDSWELDVLGSIRVGMRCIWINRDHKECPDPTLALEIPSFDSAAQVMDFVGLS